MVSSIGAVDALSAYGRANGIGAGKPAAPAETEARDTGFGEMVTAMVGGTAQALGKAEQAGMAQVAGKGDLIDMVTAIGAAETALDTMVAVRDRVVNAYNEIMRMQI